VTLLFVWFPVQLTAQYAVRPSRCLGQSNIILSQPGLLLIAVGLITAYSSWTNHCSLQLESSLLMAVQLITHHCSPQFDSSLLTAVRLITAHGSSTHHCSRQFDLSLLNAVGPQWFLWQSHIILSHCGLQFNAAQCSSMQFNAAQCSSMLLNAVQCCSMQFNAAQSNLSLMVQT
jgi:hypothetical protein